MSCIPRREYKKACANSARLSAARVLGLFLAGAWLAGCATHGEVHPEYASLVPEKICVLPITNASLLDLHEVSFGGIFQRALVGPQTYDVMALVRGATAEALVLKGYQAFISEPKIALTAGGERGTWDFSKPLPKDRPSPPFDAACLVTILAWEIDRVSNTSMKMDYRVEMYNVPTAELLYSGTFTCGYREDPLEQGSQDLRLVIRRAMKDAFIALPVKE